jgi:hypothetical protein
MTLWLRSWDQVPAGSLPADERSLCRLAELGRDLRTWRKIAPDALHGWFTASDGRLYHPVVTEIVTEAWERKKQRSNRTEKARSSRLSQKPNSSVIGSVTDELAPAERKGEEGFAEGEAIGLEGNRLDKTTQKLRANGHTHTHAPEDDDQDNFFDEDDFVPFGRSAPLAASPPLRGKELKEHRKALLLQKLMRFANDTMSERERQTAINGLMGLDAQHSAQSWLDALDQQMRAARWDDTQ